MSPVLRVRGAWGQRAEMVDSAASTIMTVVESLVPIHPLLQTWRAVDGSEDMEVPLSFSRDVAARQLEESAASREGGHIAMATATAWNGRHEDSVVVSAHLGSVTVGRPNFIDVTMEPVSTSPLLGTGMLRAVLVAVCDVVDGDIGSAWRLNDDCPFDEHVGFLTFSRIAGSGRGLFPRAVRRQRQVRRVSWCRSDPTCSPAIGNWCLVPDGSCTRPH